MSRAAYRAAARATVERASRDTRTARAIGLHANRAGRHEGGPAYRRGAPNVALAAQAREQLEHLCRYLLRPPLALERLTESSGGQLLYELPHPRRDGSTHLLLAPLELIEKLSVLIPRPGFTCSGSTASWPPAPSFAPTWSPTRAGPPSSAGARRQALRLPSPGAVPPLVPEDWEDSPGRP